MVVEDEEIEDSPEEADEEEEIDLKAAKSFLKGRGVVPNGDKRKNETWINA